MTAVIILSVTGIALALAIGLVVKFFGVEQDPRVEQIGELMPGANCGGCGFAGCGDYVQAMVAGKAKPGLCPSMTKDAIAEASKILGVDAETAMPKVAVVCCSGDDDHASRMAFYNGVNDCQNATLVAGGGKGCVYGCLGLGACARACPFGAIEISPKHIAIVHPSLCKGCGKCASACPRHIIKLVPRTAKIHVFCSSPESGKIKKPFCSAACIGCRKCAKTAEEGQISINGFLASVNYGNPPAEAVADACPTHCLRKPSAN